MSKVIMMIALNRRKQSMKMIFKVISIAIGWLFLISCDSKKVKNFSILPDANIYAQNGVYEPRKIDVLWIIDNSGSMQTSQDKLVANFQSFIEKFKTLKFDFHIAVGATDGWKSLFDSTKPQWGLRDGDWNALPEIHSGIFVIDKNTPDIVDTFVTNARLGAHPFGDERAFQSIYATLTNPNNANFRRQDAFLAIIILSDEDDFSSDTKDWLRNDYNDSRLHSVQSYVEFLDSYTGRANQEAPANYSVSAITIEDESCKTELSTDGFTERIQGFRYMELASLTGGSIGSLCAPFDSTLSNISDSIVNYTSVFPLTRVPKPETIVIHVNGELIPNDEDDGWTYRESDNSIWFHGASTPPAGSDIRIDFDPANIKL